MGIIISMNKKIVAGFIIALVLLLTLFVFVNRTSLNQREVVYTLGTKTYRLWVADTRESWERGLMFFRRLDGVDGMIFLFPDKQYRTFWNKNTYLDLDVLWLEDDRVVGRGFLPSIEKSERIVTVSSNFKVNKVIELKR